MPWSEPHRPFRLDSMALTAGKASRSLREFDLIGRISRRYGRPGASIIQGIGDDAAVVASQPDQWLILTTDLLAEDVHFDRRTATWTDIGFRAAIANLSDIAAMGGTPLYLLTALAIPQRTLGREVDLCYRGMMAACRPYKVRLIGGDTSASSSGWFLSITLIGSVSPQRALFRHGARVGDGIYVTGTLGDSLAGLTLLQSASRTSHKPLSAGQRQMLINRHLRPTARVSVGRWLSQERLATSAIDLSDGLSGDLRHICKESHVGAEVDIAALPLSPACRAFSDEKKTDPSALTLTGGRDYELLFTTPRRLQPKMEHMGRKRGFRITRIGTIIAASQGILARLPDGRRHLLPATSYEHFRGTP